MNIFLFVPRKSWTSIPSPTSQPTLWLHITVALFSYRDVSLVALLAAYCVCLCGFVEGSIARGRGLLRGWLKAASLFAYQITCGRDNTDLHGRKQTGCDIHLARLRLDWERRTAV